MILSFAGRDTEQPFNAIARRAITPPRSIRFGIFSGQSDDFWHGLAVECECRAIPSQRPQLTAHIQPAQTPGAA